MFNGRPQMADHSSIHGGGVCGAGRIRRTARGLAVAGGLLLWLMSNVANGDDVSNLDVTFDSAASE